MRNDSGEISLISIAAKISAEFTAAVTNIITSDAHGLSAGDCVRFTTSDTLPAGLSLATNYYVVSPTTNTFKLSAALGGPEVDITDTGTGTHTYVLQGKQFLASDFKSVRVAIHSSDNAAVTLNFKISDQKNVDFNAAASPTNRWEYVDLRALDSGNASWGGTIDGTTGVVLAGTDISQSFEVNTNGFTWLSVTPSSYTAGSVSVIATGFNND
jgi:hypothetical protein